MRNYGKIVIVFLLAALVLSANAWSGKRSKTETYANIDKIRINTVSGDCIINKGEGDQVTIEVVNSYRPRDTFESKVKERNGTLRITERIYGSNSGSARWTITVPDGIEVEFSTASGDMSVNDVEGRFEATTASGDIELEGCSGRFEISTASGDINVDNCHGEFMLSTASGSVDAIGVVLDEESSFATASGRVDVTLAESAKYDLNIGSASGSAILDFGGNPIEGAFEFEAKVRSGRIVCPVDFDDEETYRRWGDKYVRKTFTRGTDTPLITIGTASGRAVLKEG